MAWRGFAAYPMVVEGISTDESRRVREKLVAGRRAYDSDSTREALTSMPVAPDGHPAADTSEIEEVFGDIAVNGADLPQSRFF